MRVLIYCRVSTREQGDSGLGLEAQQAKCFAELQSRGWQLATLVTETNSAGKKRPKLDDALRMLDVGQADALMVSRIDRLARSVGELALMMDRAHRNGWKLVVLDPPTDMTTPYGRMMAQVAMAFAELERELGSIRTKDGLERLRERGITKNGKVYEGPGAKPYSDQKTIRRIVRFREDGMTQPAIAEWLTEHEVPAPGGGPIWNHKTVAAILKREGVK